MYVDSNNMSYDELLNDLIRNYSLNNIAINISFRDIVCDIKNINRATHLIHPYPAKLLVHIPYFFLNNEYFGGKGLNVYDPFCGSGTVLLESLLSQKNAYGADTNPLARLIARVKTFRYDCERLAVEMEAIVVRINKNPQKEYPSVINIDYWYSEKNKKDLQCLYESIELVKDDVIKDFFLVCFSVIANRFSNCDPNISVPVRIKYKIGERYCVYNRRYEKVVRYICENDVVDVFCMVVSENIVRIERYNALAKDSVGIVKIFNDARQNMMVNNIDLVLTSPPYVGAQKYIRSSSLSLGWLRMVDSENLKIINRLNIGRESFKKVDYDDLVLTGINSGDQIIKTVFHKSKVRAYMISCYLREMIDALSAIYGSMRSGAYLIMVVANNTVCGERFYVDQCFAEICRGMGMNIELVLLDEIRSRGLLTKRHKSAGVISNEVIMIMKKV